MNREQEEIVHAFMNAYNLNRKEPLAIYGTGINAEAVLTCCKEYPIAGVIDLAKTGERFCGFPVMPLKEVIKKRLKKSWWLQGRLFMALFIKEFGNGVKRMKFLFPMSTETILL